MHIGDNLRKVRNKRELTHQEIADFLGVDRRTYIDWENGVTDMKVSYLLKLAEFLQVDVDELLPTKSRDIVITQNNSDNKDGSINGIVFLLTDKETIDQIFNAIKPILEKDKNV